MHRPAGFLIDVPVTLTVAVRGTATLAEAMAIARTFAEQLDPSQAYVDGYSGMLDQGVSITEATLESNPEDACEEMCGLQADEDGDAVQADHSALTALQRELAAGQRAFRALAVHTDAMGSAESTLTVNVGGSEYQVTAKLTRPPLPSAK